jgi:hypothetical protein
MHITSMAAPGGGSVVFRVDNNNDNNGNDNNNNNSRTRTGAITITGQSFSRNVTVIQEGRAQD